MSVNEDGEELVHDASLVLAVQSSGKAFFASRVLLRFFVHSQEPVSSAFYIVDFATYGNVELGTQRHNVY